MSHQRPDGLIRMNELSKQSGVSASTIKYYVKEGLVDIAYKTGPNMAYYRPDSVTRVKRIKMLQTEKYYPLAVIKRLIDSNEFDAGEMELLDVIHKTGRDSSTARYSLSEALRMSGLTREQAESIVRAGIVTPLVEGRKRLFRESDCRMLALVKARLDAGIPFAQTLASFRAYADVLQSASAQDIEGLIVDPLLSAAHDTRAIVRIIRTSDDTLNEFIMLKRYEFNSRVGSERIAALGAFTAALQRYLEGLPGLLTRFGYAAQAEAVGFAARGEGAFPAGTPLCVVMQVLRTASSGLALSLAACSQANDVLRRRSSPAAGADGEADAPLTHCLALGWATLAPKEFGASDVGATRNALLEAAGPELVVAVTQLLQTCRNGQDKIE